MQITAAVAPCPNQPFSLENIELEEPRDNEVLLRLVATGICHTDLYFRYQVSNTAFPKVFGNEGAGIIDKVLSIELVE